MTLGDAARRVRPVDGRMLFAVLVGLFLAVMVEGPACALEFTADLIMHANGKTHASNLYYRDDRWRLEHQDIGVHDEVGGELQCTGGALFHHRSEETTP